MSYKITSRKVFIQDSLKLVGGFMAANLFSGPFSGYKPVNRSVILSGHLWVYASKFPPDWDCTPILEEVFSDFQYAGLQGVEMMESNLRHDDVVPRVGELIEKYQMPVTGTSYYGDMWNQSQTGRILEDAEMVIQRLHQLGGTTFGITVGDAGRKKTEDELDIQAEVLKKLLVICENNNIEPNLHNHTFELVYDLHDLNGTLERVPELKLGPDLNWLVRGGVDPVWFIHQYGDRIVYLHIRDQDEIGRWTHVVGEGVTDFPAIACALQKVGFSGRAAVELAFEEPPETSVRNEWKESRSYIREVFGW